MSNEDDNDASDADWPPKRSGRRKIVEARPSASLNEPAEPEGEEPPISERIELPGGVKLEAAVRSAFATSVEESASVDVLRGVQDRLRERSGGKFYGDGWSTTRHPPFSTFFITSLMMLAVVAIIYAILVPLVGDPIPLPKESQPVQILPRGTR
jgi:hypothetical protein